MNRRGLPEPASLVFLDHHYERRADLSRMSTERSTREKKKIGNVQLDTSYFRSALL
jgi:hypothetical protein